MIRLRRAPSEGAHRLLPDLELPRGETRGEAGLTRIGAAGTESPRDFEALGARAVAAAPVEARHLALDTRGFPAGAARSLAMGAAIRVHRFSLKSAPGHRKLEVVTDAPRSLGWERAEATLAGMAFARDCIAEPANRLSPEGFTQRLQALEKEGLSVRVLDAARLKSLGAGGLLAVGGGAVEPPRLVEIRWKGSLDAPPVAFAGKGLCFDTGGISIKPAAGMEAMRADMAGAAACAGAMLSLARRRSPCPAVALLAIAENTTGARSYRPGDVLRMASGLTVEVLDTDAEGRLVLADALHLAARRHRPRALIDLATLTGSVIVALGHVRAGLFGNDAALATAIAAAGESVGERVWPLPIGERHREDLRSDIADLRQCAPAGSGAWGGRLLPDACHAAAFLREFAGSLPWAHLDIAGVDTAEDDEGLAARGQPTGFGVRLLDALVERHFEDPHRV
ncbi:leucyl aminopeptidase family protein [Sabulicella rubraurantiaca]|uniref:leucyl aminopeptidase family protein n=1 Tax=Sabulicella rubraurantiaca TaxID=2811429 RepID=UPI001A9613E9|nr:leucyl aminopeptidase family protein [Sabulicella rubraurantiaca]